MARTKECIFAGALMLTLLIAGPAYGQSSLGGYGGQGGEVEGAVGGGRVTDRTVDADQGLAFTGTDVALLAAIALVLVLSGLVLKRISAGRKSA